ncbi:hypothetical protein [Halalkalibacter sp. APA_J-10(15)]|uniref:hypothetical protein n=1 Tax=Halalkalibacter sp. APA_J-10(15) TaxID=2933805 RepID=UPI001FF58BCC|nr:hypothetical protein [Halalkalibacter sp. APA_J-10(15)]MCK0471922.1 hypothetical protein [Halalkalibacter sp. APA_J-10(15)]
MADEKEATEKALAYFGLERELCPRSRDGGHAFRRRALNEPVDFNLPFPEAIEKVEINFFSTFDLTSNGFTRCSIDTRNPLNQSSQNRQRFRTLLKGHQKR